MEEKQEIEGKTYSLRKCGAGSQEYYLTIKGIASRLLERFPDEKALLAFISKPEKSSFLQKLTGGRQEVELAALIRETLYEALSGFTKNVDSHLKDLSVAGRFDTTLATKEWQYHLYMLEIELVNRIYREKFLKARYKFALIGHCLRDFRPECMAVTGDVEEVCQGCTEDCFVHLGSELMRKYGIHPYISVEMDQRKLFRDIKARHTSVGALGIACVPELAEGMRLCIKLGIPPVGVPLDANRCSRWMGRAHESFFNLKELEELIGD